MKKISFEKNNGLAFLKKFFILGLFMMVWLFAGIANGQLSAHLVLTGSSFTPQTIVLEQGSTLNITIPNTVANHVYRIQRTSPADPSYLDLTSGGGDLVIPPVLIKSAGEQVITVMEKGSGNYMKSFTVNPGIVTGNNSMMNLFNGQEGQNRITLKAPLTEEIETVPALVDNHATICTGGGVIVKVSGSTNGDIYRLQQTDPVSPSFQLKTGNGGTMTFDSPAYATVNSIWTITNTTSYTLNKSFYIDIVAQPTAPTLTLDPAEGSVCAGTDISAVLNTGGTDGFHCSDSYDYSLDGGSSWSPYTLGTDIPTTGAGLTSVKIRAKRSDSEGRSCSAENIYSWTVITHVHNVTPGHEGNYCTIQQAIDAAFSGDEIHVDAGTYIEWVVINKSLTILGPNAGVDPNTETRGLEAIILPNHNSPYDDALVSIQASNVTFKGFSLNGDNPSISGGEDVMGVDVNMSDGIQNGPTYGTYYQIDNLTIENNIFQNFTYDGVFIWETFGVDRSFNYIHHNYFFNMWEGVQTYAMQAEVSYNKFDQVNRGLSMHGVHVATDPGFSPKITHNTINIEWTNPYNDREVGIWVNYRDATAPDLEVSDNVINTPTAFDVGKTFYGFFASTISNDRVVTFKNNTINGDNNCTGGFYTSNCPSNNLVIQGGSFNDIMDYGILAVNRDASWGAGNVKLTVDNVKIKVSSGGIGIKEEIINPYTTTVSVDVKNGTEIWDPPMGGIGILLKGSGATITFSGTAPSAKLHDLDKYIVYESNGTTVPATATDATTVEFDGDLGSAMTLAKLFDVEDKITHKIDYSSFGFVTVKNGNDFVTTNSFIAPHTTSALIQRAIDAASTGWTVNVDGGTYTESVNVNKSVTILGAQAGVTGFDPTRPAIDESEITQTVAVPSAGVYVSAGGAVVDGFVIRKTTPGGSGVGVGLAASGSGYEIRNNIIQNNTMGLYMASEGTNQTKIVGNYFLANNVAGSASGDAIYGDQRAVNILVDNNKFENNTSGSMVFVSSVYGPYGPLSNLVVSNNTFLGKGPALSAQAAYYNGGLNTDLQVFNNQFSGGNTTSIGLRVVGVDNAQISSNTFTGYTDTDIDVQYLSTLVTIENNLLSNSARGVYVRGWTNGADVAVHQNSFTNCSVAAIVNYEPEAWPSYTPVDATCNWWGDVCYDNFISKITGLVTYSPWLIDGTNTATGLGFIPLTGICTGVIEEVTEVSLQSNTTGIAPWSPVTGNLAGGYNMCLDAAIPFYYLDINTLTTSLPLEIGVKNAFSLPSPNATLIAYWAAHGITGPGSGWQGVIWNIINGTAPIFYIVWDGSDYKLIDGLQWQAFNVEAPLRVNGDYPQDTYSYVGKVENLDGCLSDNITVTMQFNTIPAVSAVSMQTNTTGIAPWSPVNGDLGSGYYMCIDPVTPWYYLDINALTSSVTLNAGAMNAFTLDGPNANLIAYWADHGIPSDPGTGWQHVMWEIIHGTAPTFYITFDGSDYQLIDGLQWQAFSIVAPLRVNGEFPQGTYEYNGTVLGNNGCVSNEISVSMTFNSDPVLVITDPATVCAPATIDITAAAITAGSSLNGGTLSYWEDADATVPLLNPASISVPGTYYIKATTLAGCSDIKAVIVTIDPATVGGTVGSSDLACGAKTGGTLFLTGQTGNVVKWEQSINNGVFWTDILTTDTYYRYPALSHTTMYRAIVKSGVCNEEASVAATIYTGVESFIGSATNCYSEGIVIPVTVRSFKDVGSISLTINFDQNALEFAGASDYGTPNDWLFDVGLLSAGTIRAAGIHPFFLGFDLPDDAVLFKLHFNYIGANTGGSFAVTFNDTDADNCQYGSSLPPYFDIFCDTPYGDFYHNGSVSVYGQLVAGTTNGDQTICYNAESPALTANEPGGGSGTYTYQWEILNGTLWEAVVGATDLIYSPGQLTADATYRLMQTDTYCSPDQVVYTTPQTVDVYGSFSAGTAGEDQTICFGETPDQISSTTPNGGSGTFQYQWQKFIGPDWFDLPGENSLTYTVGSLSSSAEYRLKQTDTYCSPAQVVYTNSVYITVHEYLDNGTASGDQTICNGETPEDLATTAPSGGSGTFTYQWQLLDGSIWNDILGATGMTYNPGSMTISGEYRVKQTDTFCDPDQVVYTNSVKITVHELLIAGEAGTDQVLCFGETPATLSADAPGGGSGTFTYQWQIWNGTSWENLSGENSLDYSPGALTATTEYRLEQTDTYCDPDQVVYTNVVTITIYGELTAGSASLDQTICYGEAPVTLNATEPSGGNGSYTYIWQVLNGTSWDDISGETSLSYSPGSLTISQEYRVKQTNSFCEPDQVVYTNAVTITVHGQLTAGLATADQTICNGETPEGLSSTIPSGGSGTFSYQWQMWSEFVKLPSWSDIPGATDLIYYPGALTATNHYRLIQTDAFCDPDQVVITNSVTITVHALLVAGTAGINQTLCNGETPAELTASSPTGGSSTYTYQWQVLNGTSWEDIIGASLQNYTPGPLSATTEYRLKQSDNFCDPVQSVYTNVVTITVHGVLTPGIAGSAQTICKGETPAGLSADTPSGGSGTFIYQWQVWNGATWDDILGETNLAYAPGTLTSTTEYRLKQSDTYCSPDQEVFTNVVTITVYSTLIAGSAGSDQLICYADTPSDLLSTSATGGSGSYSFQWQIFNGTSWDDILGANNLSYGPGSLTITSLYRIKQSDTYCNPDQVVYSNIVTVTVDQGNTISGTLKYYKAGAANVSMNNVTLWLLSGGNYKAAYTTDAVTGHYEFNHICGGDYTIVVHQNNKPVGGINATDAAQVNWWQTHFYNIERVRFQSGDNTFENYINATDAYLIQYYFVTGTPFERTVETGTPWTYYKAGDIIASNFVPGSAYLDAHPDMEVTMGSSPVTYNIYGMAIGDFNGSFTPGGAKETSTSVQLVNGDVRQAGSNSEIEVPVRIVHSSQVGAVSLILNFPENLVEIKDVTIADGNLNWAVKGNELRIGWHTGNPLNLSANGALLTLKLKTTGEFVTGKSIRFSLASDPLNELADNYFNVIPDAILSMDVLEASPIGIPEHAGSSSLNLQNRPNPFNEFTTISYSLPFAGQVTLEIHNLIGENIKSLVDELQVQGDHSLRFDAGTLVPGVYTATIKLRNNSDEIIRTIKILKTR